MPNLNAQQVADAWAAGMASAGTKMKNGVMAVTQSPMEAAANAVDRQVAGVQRAAAEGRTQAALRAVSTQSWQNSYINKGIPRIQQGASAAKPKMAAFLTQFLPAQDAIRQSLPARGDINQNIQRAVQMMTQTATLKGRFKQSA